MDCAGFVLTGGRSSRMGCDKALLPFRGRTLVEHVAGAVRAATGSVTLIGDPALYGRLGLPVIPDAWPGCGPLGGIYSALAASSAAWNLVLACDMPGAAAEFFSRLMTEARAGAADCIVPAGSSGRPEPLCAAYHARCREPIRLALEQGVRKVMQGLAACRVRLWPVEDDAVFQNCNTPAEWAGFAGVL